MKNSELALERLSSMPRGSWDWIAARAQLDVCLEEEFPGSVPRFQAMAARKVHDYTLKMLSLAGDASKDDEAFRKEMGPLQGAQKNVMTLYIQHLYQGELGNAMSNAQLPRSEEPMPLYGLKRIGEFREHVSNIGIRGARP